MACYECMLFAAALALVSVAQTDFAYLIEAASQENGMKYVTGRDG